MEKLLNLLNEYGDIVNLQYYLEDGKIKIARADNYTIAGYIDLEIISKKFGFIKWLVEKDKINRNNVLRMGYEIEDGLFYHYDDYYCLLMLLSISSSPIDDLILYLK